MLYNRWDWLTRSIITPTKNARPQLQCSYGLLSLSTTHISLLSVCLSVCHYMSAIRSDDIIRFKYDQCVTTGTSVVRLLKTGDNAA